MGKLFIILGATAAFLAVSLGAFGAHALKSRFGDQHIALWQTATQYQMWHALALLMVGKLLLSHHSFWIEFSGYSLCVGIVLFSGSLYALSLTGIKKLGMLTPVGGLAFIIAWLAIIMWAIKSP